MEGLGSGSWDFGFRRPLKEDEITEATGLLNLLSKVVLAESRADSRRWEKDTSGCFTCKSYRKTLVLGGRHDVFHPFTQIWKAKAPPKVKVLAWLVALRKVNTGDIIQRKRPHLCVSPFWCILCKSDMESADHLFLHCPYSIKLWWKLLCQFQISWAVPKGCYELLSLKVGLKGKRMRTVIIWGCLVHGIIWNIWAERNRRIFNNTVGLSPEELWDRVKFEASIWASVNAQFKDYQFGTIMNNLEAVVV